MKIIIFKIAVRRNIVSAVKIRRKKIETLNN